jgi:hypothetical protein
MTSLLVNMKTLSPSEFSTNLFWDVDTETLDIERHLKYVVARVLEFGTFEDWLLVYRRLTLPTILEIAQSLRSLDTKALAFLSTIGHVPRETFRCYTLKPSTQTHWIS